MVLRIARGTSGFVTRCGRDDLGASPQHEIHVTNNGHQTVNSLRLNIDGFEMFIVLDLDPSQATVLSTLPQTDRNVDRSAMTYWGNSLARLFRGAAFDIRGKYKGPAHYFINLAGHGVSITSREFLPAS